MNLYKLFLDFLRIFRVVSANIKKSTNLENFGKGANRGGVLGSRVVLPEDYVPNDKEEFMNEMQNKSLCGLVWTY